MGALPLGFFGKLPSRGDFVQANLPTDFVSAWDDWLQQILVSSQASLADAWLDCYLAMPIWHFALSAGVCGAAPIAGIMLTSVDAAGRYFPMTLAVKCDSETAEAGLPLILADRIDLAYALEDVALAALHADARFEAFTDQLESLSLPKKCRFLTSQAGADASTSLMQSLVRDALLAKRTDWTGASLWWAKWGDQTRLIDEDGLPNPDRFATMLISNGDMTKATLTEALMPLPQDVVEPPPLSPGTMAECDPPVPTEILEP